MFETKLYLIWLSCKSFDSLKKGKNRILLGQVWENTKNELEYYFRNNRISLQSILDSFNKIRFTINPTEVGEYDPRIDALILNLWALLFHPIALEFCAPTHPLKICESLVHEYDHYCYLKENELIGKQEEKIAEFSSKHYNEVEKRALLSQCDFLEMCKKKAFSHKTSYRIRVNKWSEKGKPLNPWIQPFPITRETTLSLIDGMISDVKNILSQMAQGGEYETIASESSRESYARMVSLLSLPIKFPSREEDYPFVEIKG
jgi:hypothetical protein